MPLATLTSAPYNLVFGDSVYATVTATNVKGPSVESEAGNGADVITKPDPPINLAEDTQHRTPTVIGLTWEQAPQDGGSVVIDYRISIAE